MHLSSITIDAKVEVDPEEILDSLGVAEIIEYIGESAILDYITEERCIEYFKIDVKED